MNDRKFIPLHKISEMMSHDDIPGNWVTIGIVSHKSMPKPTKNGDTYSLSDSSYCSIDISDLRNTSFRLFLFGTGFERHWKLVIGSVLTLLNPNILQPSEVRLILTLARWVIGAEY